MTITREFTKEQLSDRIVQQRETNTAIQEIIAAQSTKSAELALYSARMDAAILDIALAVLTTEVAAWTDEDELEEMDQCGIAKIFRSRQMMGRPDPERVVKLCRLPKLNGNKNDQ